MSVRALEVLSEHSGVRQIARSSISICAVFGQVCLHGSHLAFIFYQNVSILVGGEEPMASPLL